MYTITNTMKGLLVKKTVHPKKEKPLTSAFCYLLNGLMVPIYTRAEKDKVE